MKSPCIFLAGCLLILVLGACGDNPTSLPTSVLPTVPRISAPTTTLDPYPPPGPTIPPSTAYPSPEQLTRIAQYTPAPTWTPLPTFTPKPSITPSLTPTIPTPIPGLEPEPLQIISPDALVKDGALLHDLILFETNANFPFNYKKYGSGLSKLVDQPTGWNFEINAYELWVISPDGHRMGRLSLPRQGSKIFTPSSQLQKPLIIEYGFHLDNSVLKVVPLPEECYAFEEVKEDYRQQEFYYCGNFKFSPDGRYLSFTFNEDNCSRMLSILDVNSGKVIYQKMVNMVFPEFVNNEKVFINIGHCEGGASLLVNLKTGTEQKVGDYAWSYDWNSPHSAFLVGVHPYQGFITSSFWGYNDQTGQFFAPPQIKNSSQWPSTWVPAGTYILYEQREFTADDKYGLDIHARGNSQIMRFDLATEKVETILATPQYDFWLCGGPHFPCTFKHPDWIKVARSWVPTDPAELEVYQANVMNCLWRWEEECSSGLESLALNWRTGELLPWDQAPSGAVPTSFTQYKLRGNDGLPLPPDQNSRLVYAHPSGDYAFYVGADGTSLWRVVKNGRPVVWVENGENFIYLP